MENYENLLCAKNEVFVYQIPARTSNRGYRAADWKLDEPDWTGKLKVTAKGRDLVVKLEDRTSGELFAKCPVEAYPSPVIEQVLDSSRYFVIRIQDDSGRHAFIGIGFADRGDSFDLLVAIQDHFNQFLGLKELNNKRVCMVCRQVKRDAIQETENTSASSEAQFSSIPKLDLGFKEGQTIKLNISTKKQTEGTSAQKSRPNTGASGGILLPPPPGSGAPKIAPPAGGSSRVPPPVALSPAHNVSTQPARVAAPSSNLDLLVDFGASHNAAPAPAKPASALNSANEWEDFTSAVSSKLTLQQQPQRQPAAQPAQKSGPNAGSWENFE